MSDLVAWLRDQIDEDEQVALAASPGPWSPNAESDEVVACDGITVADGFALSGRQLRATVEHIARHDPARVLAEVEAKRAILERHKPSPAGDCEHDGWPWPCADVLTLAKVYADRPGYDEAVSG